MYSNKWNQKQNKAYFHGGSTDNDALDMSDFSAFHEGIDDSVTSLLSGSDIVEPQSNVVDNYVTQAQIETEVNIELKRIWEEKVKPYANEPDEIVYEKWIKTYDGKKLKREVTKSIKDQHAGLETGDTSKVGDWLASDRGQNTINTILGGIGAFFGGKNRASDSTRTDTKPYIPDTKDEGTSPVTVGIIALGGIVLIGTLVFLYTRNKPAAAATTAAAPKV